MLSNFAADEILLKFKHRLMNLQNLKMIPAICEKKLAMFAQLARLCLIIAQLFEKR